MNLVEEFHEARAQASSGARYTVESVPPKTCRYCGKHWTPWPGTKLDGHSRCIVPRTFQVRLAAIPTTTKSGKTLAAELGVSYSVWRSWTSLLAARRAA